MERVERIVLKVRKDVICSEEESKIIREGGRERTYSLMLVESETSEDENGLCSLLLQAWNSQGPGPISEPVEIFTAEDMPQVQPTEVSAFAHNATSLNVTWQPIEPTRENIRGKLIGYRVGG